MHTRNFVIRINRIIYLDIVFNLVHLFVIQLFCLGFDHILKFRIEYIFLYQKIKIFYNFLLLKNESDF